MNKYVILKMRYFIIFFFLLVSLGLQAQEVKLAQQYYSTGEYEKAATLYQKLLSQNENNEYYFNKYIECLMALQDFESGEKAIRKQIKKFPKEVSYYVSLGKLLERQNRKEEAEAQYTKAVEELPADQGSIIKLANAFVTLANYNKAIETYEKGSKLLNNKSIFSYSLADLYFRKGDTAKMIQYYLYALSLDTNLKVSLQTFFQNSFTDKEYDELQAQLLEKIQENPDNLDYVEMLVWQYMQRKNYASALRYTKSIDKRLQGNGSKIYQLGSTALLQKDYDAAIDAFTYIITEKGKISPYYIEAKKEQLKARRLKITDTYNYTQEDLKQIEADYENFIETSGKNFQTSQIMLEWATMEGLYLNNLPKAISILNEMINLQGINRNIQAEAKLQLGDFYLMTGEVWEATLLYSQVDKDFGEDVLGHEARFRNAKLSYYNGDFDWAQAQFDVLKASTSKLISNDAIDLSVFILDNVGLDSITKPLAMYAQAELLVFQNKIDEAFSKLDSISTNYPEHGLLDDIAYLKAKIYTKRKDYTKAIEMYSYVVEKFPEDIRADNALFEMADLYENALNDKEKAKELYEKLFMNYSNSILATDARKRFRQLRGDKIFQ